MSQDSSVRTPAWLWKVETQYEYLGEIGRGGMALVHLVRHRSWNLEIAVKTPLLISEGGQSDLDQARLHYFIREANAWSRMVKHPNIVTCYYVRELGGLPRIFIEYVPGQTLQDWIQLGRTRDPKVALDIAIQICDGMSNAASEAIHRDLKPSNILIDERGHIKITDFGLARIWDRKTDEPLDINGVSKYIDDSESQITHGWGTKEYRSPEHGTAYSQDIRLDIWSFGILIWEMLTSSRPATPSDGRGAPEFIKADFKQQKRSDIPKSLLPVLIKCVAPLESRWPDFITLREQLQTVYHKVEGIHYLRKSPTTADLLATDFNNKALSMLDLGNEIAAERYWKNALQIDKAFLPAIYNRALFRWRKGSISDADIVEPLTLLSKDSLSLGYEHYLLALIQLVRSDPDEAQAHLMTLFGSMSDEPDFQSALGIAAFDRGDFQSAKACFEAVLKQAPHRLNDAWNLACSCSKLGDSERVGEALARIQESTGKGRPKLEIGLSDSTPASIRDSLDRLESTQPRRIRYHGEVMLRSWSNAVRFAPSRDRLVVGTTDRELGWIYLNSDQPIFRPFGKTEEPIWCAEYLPDGRLLTGDDAGTLYLWDFNSTHPAAILRDGQQQACRNLAIRADGKLAISGELSRHARVWDLESLTCTARIELPTMCRGVAFTDEPETVLLLDGDGNIHRFHLGEGILDTPLPITEGGLANRLKSSADGKHALVSHGFYTIWWNVHTQEILRSLPIRGGTHGPVLSRNEEWALSSSPKGLAVVEISSGVVLHTLRPPVIASMAYDLSPDLQWIAATDKKTIRLWRLSGFDSPRLPIELPYLLSAPSPAVASIESSKAFDDVMAEATEAAIQGSWTKSYDAIRKAQKISGYERNQDALDLLHLLATKGRRIGLRAAWKSQTLRGHTMHLSCVAFNPNPRTRVAMSGGWDGTIRLWELTSGRTLYSSPPLTPIIQAVRLTGDDRALIGGAGGKLFEYDLIKHALTKIKGDNEPIWGDMGPSIEWAFSADGTFAVANDDLGRLECWDTVKRRTIWRAQSPAPYWVVMNSDGSLVITGKRSLYFWEIIDGGLVWQWNPLNVSVSSLAFSPDDSEVALVGEDGSFSLWNLRTATRIRQFDGHLSYPASLAFSPDGDWILTGSDKDLILWNVYQDAHVLKLEGHAGTLAAVAFSPDGRWALSGAWGKELFLWEFDWELDFLQNN